MLAIGATGQFAGLVVPALVSSGVEARALVHDPAKRERVRDAGADQAVVGGLLAMFADYTAHGFHGGNSLALRAILGRTPRSLNDFFAELAR